MASYFLTFNPEKGNFSDYGRAVDETRTGRTYSDTWKVNSARIVAIDSPIAGAIKQFANLKTELLRSAFASGAITTRRVTVASSLPL